MRIDGSKTINGTSYLKLATIIGLPGWEPRINYVRRSSEGVFTIDAEDKSLAEVVDTPFPLVIGTTWTAKNYTYRVESIESLELLDRQVEDCLKISYKSTNGTHGVKWLAKGIGMAKQIHRTPEGTIMEYVLEKHEP